jgi:hypothetical protein
MSELVEVRLPDGEIVWARVSSAGGPHDVGLRDRVLSLKGLTETVRAVARNLRDGLDAARPDETTVEFGLELALGGDGLVPVIVGVDASAAITVSMTWKRRPADQLDPAGAGG